MLTRAVFEKKAKNSGLCKGRIKKDTLQEIRKYLDNEDAEQEKNMKTVFRINDHNELYVHS